MIDSNPTSTPTETAPAEQVLVLPGHLFFIERIEVPVDLEPSEIQDFVELSLESIAPFPIDQLNWGYLYSEDAPDILLYATHRDRLMAAGYTELQSYAWVLPDFSTLTGACFPDETLVALESADNVSLLLFAKGASIPSTVLVTPLAEASLGNVLKAVNELKASAPDLPKTAATLNIRTSAVELNEQGLPTFVHESADDSRSDLEYGAWTTLAPTEAQLWQSDVRSADFKETERSARRLGAVLLRITGWAAILSLVLIVGEILLMACLAWVGTLDNQLASQQSAVFTVEEKQALMVKLEQVSQNELRPIAILDAANTIRLAQKLGIEYDSAIIEGQNHITIEGKATSINALNTYTEHLKRSGQFEIVAAPESITRAGNTTFTVTLAYTHIEQDAPIAEEEVIVVEEAPIIEETVPTETPVKIAPPSAPRLSTPSERAKPQRRELVTPTTPTEEAEI
ncbi:MULTISPECIES: hypothetical protein [unclassified Lentimonas]|uniref:hypothetical protein n=1 Tax=unclassified Lentimonas TaxID=2630993 RepID=UPI00132B649A|nr:MULTISPECIES: hypothetical protein [unclassified Lentimonas]CAA6690607.1 Unannotated [Lentimonas sp. CC10]CAA6695259.1 Unannotated [Lentimonas sp. CC19]CAA7068864.1 Unannotated [Lentimonas sp. CC11]